MQYDLSHATVRSVSDAVEVAIQQAELLVAEASAANEATYEARIAPLDAALLVLSDAEAYGPFLSNCHHDKEVRDAGSEAEERLNKWRSDLVFRRDVYEAVSDVDAASLSALEARSLAFWMRDLRRAGHELATEDREELQAMRNRLIELEVQFQRNIAESDDSIEVSIDDTAGLPTTYLEGLEDGESPNTVKVTLAYPDYSPFMEQAENRANRKTLQHKFYNQAAGENTPLLAEAISIRARVAEILGYENWAEHQMEVKMANPLAVSEFYDSLVPGLTTKAQEERDALEALLRVDHPGESLSVWDWVYYDTQQARTDFGVDQNEVAKYFPLESAISGMFEITAEVFGIEYETIDDATTWHNDVRSYRIIDTDSQQPIAQFHLDLHPRDGKYTHAACFSLQKGCRLPDESYRMPEAAVLANFTHPTDTTSSLLRHDEVLTLFHEFGHVLHFCLTEVELGRFAGFDTEWDFVEAPSQIMENWTWDGDVLRRFAAHHETGEPIPDDLIAGLVAIRNHNIGLKLLRQAYYGNLDLQFHTSGPEPDLHEIDRQTHGLTQLEIHEDTFFAASFGHLMGGYDAGYYGYLWSMVYGDDMFSVFESEGVLSPEVGRRYRKEVLASGASRDAIDHLRAFLGREPSADAFLSKIGLD
jgi:Zn-dependent oligopeptidase